MNNSDSLLKKVIELYMTKLPKKHVLFNGM